MVSCVTAQVKNLCALFSLSPHVCRVLGAARRLWMVANNEQIKANIVEQGVPQAPPEDWNNVERTLSISAQLSQLIVPSYVGVYLYCIGLAGQLGNNFSVCCRIGAGAALQSNTF